ncbi:unnamed protein product [Diamesa serratosioi]
MIPIPTITKFGNTSNTIRVLGCNPGPMTLQGTNTYLIGTGKSRLLIDSGEPNTSEYIKNLAEVINEENATIDQVIITHWHSDHIGGLKDLLSNKIINNDCKLWKFPRSDEKEDYGDLKFNKITNEQEFIVDGANLKAIHTPGHTTDHIILYDDSEKSVFSGDCILGEGTAVFEDLFDYMKSLNLILKLNPSIIYPGHGNIVNEGACEKIEYYINHRNERESQILQALKKDQEKAMSDMDIVKIVYTTTPRHLFPAAAINVQQHLIKLQKEDKVVQIVKGNQKLWQAKSSSSL